MFQMSTPITPGIPGALLYGTATLSTPNLIESVQDLDFFSPVNATFQSPMNLSVEEQFFSPLSPEIETPGMTRMGKMAWSQKSWQKLRS
jgi:hypothetical protein